MNAPLLTLLTAIIAALAGLGACCAAFPTHRRWFTEIAAGLALLAGLLALLSLLLDEPAAVMALPVGLPGVAFRVVLDPLSACFAALLFPAAAATLCFAAAADDAAERFAPLPVAVAGFGLALLAAGGPGRASGLAAGGAALWALAPPDRPAAVQLAVVLLAAAVLVAADGAPAPAVLWLALLGPGALAGLVPLHRWLAAAQAGSTPGAALLAGIAAPLALYFMLRLLVVAPAAAAAPPSWWGIPLLVLGSAGALAGGFAAMRPQELDAALAADTIRQAGTAAIGLGIALSARAADLPGVAALSLAAVLLLAAQQMLCGTLLPLAAGAIRHGAGTRHLDRLGGLIHRMPRTALCLLGGGFAAAALPPSLGFAVLWLLVHGVLGLPHGGLGWQLLHCAAVAALGLGAALGSAALLRLVGVACLGRPRTPRAAVAEEPVRLARLPLVSLAGAALAGGVAVGPLLLLLADAPLRMLTGTGLGGRATWLGLAPGPAAPGYPALALAVVLLVGALAIWAVRSRATPPRTVTGAAWDSGFAAPPGWLPFGDPLTQANGTGFVPELPEGAATAWFAARGGIAVMTGLDRTGVAPPASRPPLARTPSAAALVLILAALVLAAGVWARAP